jgi:hypothetical protein
MSNTRSAKGLTIHATTTLYDFKHELGALELKEP